MIVDTARLTEFAREDALDRGLVAGAALDARYEEPPRAGHALLAPGRPTWT